MFYCEFPNCRYSTDSRTQIANHHIVPKSQRGSNKPYNRIMLCPSCHTKVFIPSEKIGIHSQYNKDSIILLRWLDSTIGKVLEYTIIDNKEILYYKRS